MNPENAKPSQAKPSQAKPSQAKPEALSLEADAEHSIPCASPHFQTELAAQLAALVPEAVADGAINIEKLRQLLGQDTATGAERFGLFWPGKVQAIRAAQLPSTATLQPVPEQSKNWDETQNVFIEGDNLEVLKTLQRHYHGKVKLIYIDPPYNTGKDFVYRDKYQEGLKTYLEWTQQVNSEGQKNSSNSESAGRYHSNWLNMMYPRLKLAWNLLAEDGVIFISIDDNEAANLKIICDEVFGSSNFVAQFIKPLAGGKAPHFVKNAHEYLFCYIRDYAQIESLQNRIEIHTGDTTRSLRKDGDSDRREDRPEMFYSIYANTSTGSLSLEPFKGSLEITPKRPDGTDGRWRWGKNKFNNESHRLVLKQKRNGSLDIEVLTEAGTRKEYPWDSIIQDNTGSGGAHVTDLFNNNLIFSYPKNPNFIQWVCGLHKDNDALILDFFAGSATTAHAVMQLNAEDGGQRRFILVQLPEPTPADSEARKAGFATIADISRRRIELAGEKIKAEMGDKAAGLDVGFRAYKLADTQFAKWRVGSDSTPEALQQSLLAQRNGADDAASSAALLTEVLLKMGYALSERSSSRTIAGLPWQQVGQAGGDMPPLLAYMDEHQPPTLEQLRAAIDSAAAEAMRVVLLEDALAGDDALKTNALEYAKAQGVELKTA